MSCECPILGPGRSRRPFKAGKSRRSVRIVLRWKHVKADTGSRSGSVCLDVINQTWSPMFDMINIFEVFLPQLLRYPNPTDPLNGEAAALLMREPKHYDTKVKGTNIFRCVLNESTPTKTWLTKASRVRPEVCHKGGHGGRRSQK